MGAGKQGRAGGKAPARPLVIQVEHLRPGQQLVAKDLEKLRANFWWRALAPFPQELTFRIAGEARATRFTPSTESGYQWPVASSCGVVHSLSLNGIRQFFTLLPEAEAGG